MRTLIACGNCHKQYDASASAPGSSFKCGCGAIVTIPTSVDSSDATVIRCSACGAPRQEGSESCAYCHSIFTLVEQDLQASCPHCLRRISSQAKFCPGCGAQISVQLAAGAATELNCPACSTEQRLVNRMITECQVALDECHSCGGMWVTHQTFDALKQSNIPSGVASHLPNAVKLDVQGSALAPYRKCPACLQMMARKNYANYSGVLVDSCREHGLWFGCNKLSELLRWISEGGLQKSLKFEQEDAKKELLREQQKVAEERRELARERAEVGGQPSGEDWLGRLLSDILKK